MGGPGRTAFVRPPQLPQRIGYNMFEHNSSEVPSISTPASGAMSTMRVGPGLTRVANELESALSAKRDNRRAFY